MEKKINIITHISGNLKGGTYLGAGRILLKLILKEYIVSGVDKTGSG